MQTRCWDMKSAPRIRFIDSAAWTKQERYRLALGRVVPADQRLEPGERLVGKGTAAGRRPRCGRR